MRFRTTIAAVAVVCAGCFSAFPGMYSPLHMTYAADVPGAMIYQGSQLLGYAPIEVIYRWQKAALDQNQCMQLQPIEARWASGASAGVRGMKACVAGTYIQQKLFLRPNVPGRELDIQFAMQLQQTAALEAAAAAQERASLFSALAQQSAAAAQSRKIMNCSSQETNGVIHTVCY